MKFLPIFVSLISAPLLLHAQSVYTISLDPAQEGGEGRTGSGSGTITLDGTNLFLNNIPFSGLSGYVTQATIHGPARPGFIGAALYTLTPVYVPVGVQSGSINGVVPLTDPSELGGFSLEQQLSDLNASLWYINLHTTTFSAGEIRGQILPAPPPKLSIARTGKDLVISWPSYGTLLEATNLTGPFVDVTGAVSPYIVPGSAATKFYRFRY